MLSCLPLSLQFAAFDKQSSHLHRPVFENGFSGNALAGFDSRLCKYGVADKTNDHYLFHGTMNCSSHILENYPFFWRGFLAFAGFFFPARIEMALK
ncbi:hypothetical protein A4R26_30245 [Niastella populi]|uniref:Uncharacterized protein n=1 Tax=Niastella populi TaxID=550983 RepID=A0A1V9EUT0_9BACT|nr:hypothetical protein A4R26_30245 [Niastella populi]